MHTSEQQYVFNSYKCMQFLTCCAVLVCGVFFKKKKVGSFQRHVLQEIS